MHPLASFPSLFELMFGEQAGSASAVSGEQMHAWAQAFASWLAELERRLGRNYARRRLEQWSRFLKFSARPPWEVRASDVERWAAALAAQGLRPSTAYSCIVGLSGFFEFCGRERPDLFPVGKVLNPARQASRPVVPRYGVVACLNPQEVQALLGAVDRETSVVGKRDYAFLLACLRTGWIVGQVRQLKWGCPQVWERIERVEDRHAVSQALEDYLKASGRWQGMQPGEYLFAPLAGPHLPGTGHRREHWNGGKPLSSNRVIVLLKRYAGWAGLDTALVNYHCLMHTARLMHAQPGREAQSVEIFSGRASLCKTRQYLGRVRSAAGLAAARRVPPARGPCPRKAAGIPPGCQIALRHGLYAKEVPGQPAAAGPAHTGCEGPGDGPKPPPNGGSGKTIARLRQVILRTTELGKWAQTAKEFTKLLEVMGATVERLARFVRRLDQQAEWVSLTGSRAQEFIRSLEQSCEKSSEQGQAGASFTLQDVADLRKSLFGEASQGAFGEPDRVELGMEDEVGWLDEMIERAGEVGRENVRLDEGLSLLNAISLAEMRLDRCLRMAARPEKSPDDNFRDLIGRAIDDVMEEMRLDE